MTQRCAHRCDCRKMRGVWSQGGAMIGRLAAAAALCVVFGGFSPALTQSRPDEALLGRWDLVVQRGTQSMPSWLEVERSGAVRLVGQFVGSGGSARPIARIEFKEGTFRFAIPPQWERESNDLTFEGRLDGDRIAGSMTAANGEKLTWSGTRAPALRRTGQPSWSQPIKLLKGTSLDGWHTVG